MCIQFKANKIYPDLNIRCKKGIEIISSKKLPILPLPSYTYIYEQSNLAIHFILQVKFFDEYKKADAVNAAIF